MIDRQLLLDRFLKYVRIDTTADPAVGQVPSSPGQLELGRLLVAELAELGITANQDKHGIVLATIPGNVPGAPVVALNAHVDTSPETSGKNVQPQVIEDYDGQDIPLGSSGLTITTSENPELLDLRGKTLVTTDGTTLLGGDDKAGVAIIMQVVQTLLADPTIPRGDVRILFTCDEEIGLGVQHVDVAGLQADVCYTLDGPGQGHVDVETFSADGATVTFHGVNIHPAIAKDRMVNSIRAMGEFIARLPRTSCSPESTSEREGFLHPYDITAGAVDRSQLKILLRDFDTPNLSQLADTLHRTATEVEQAIPGCRVVVETYAQYRNLGDGLQREPRAVQFAVEAHERLGRTCEQSSIRGGTDGSRLTELGLPTPNLSSGQHNPHSPREFACLDEMQAAGELVLELLKRWAE